ncbi:MAG: hypothetical protein ACXVNM_01185 [Bacteroidia bacterium]
MAEIIIRGNKESYLLSSRIEYLEIKLVGDFDYISKTPIQFHYGNTVLPFENRNALFKFAEDTRGSSSDKLILLLNKYNFDQNFIKSLTDKKVTEIGLLKAIFLIYNWIELPLNSPADLNLRKQISDEFVVDWTNEPESQKDIYFINERHVNEYNSSSIQKLIELNLLVALNIKTLDITLQSYFIPLIKPGIPRELFETPVDPKGTKTHNLWQQILQERNIRISNWVNNRF